LLNGIISAKICRKTLQGPDNVTEALLYVVYRYRYIIMTFTVSVADPDQGSGAFYPLDPGSGMNFVRIPDL
jgi:hypothetical protein